MTTLGPDLPSGEVQFFAEYRPVRPCEKAHLYQCFACRKIAVVAGLLTRKDATDYLHGKAGWVGSPYRINRYFCAECSDKLERIPGKEKEEAAA
jgi:hypothetical protein